MKKENEINYDKLEFTLKAYENAGDTFPVETFYGKQIKIPDYVNKHHELLTEHIQKYFNLKFVGKIEETVTSQRGFHSLYSLLPKTI